MTSLRKWRTFGKELILLAFAWEVVATIASLAFLIYVTVQGGPLSADRLISVVGALGLYGVVICAIRHARSRRRHRTVDRTSTAELEA